jgi:hypothetical protein
MAQDSEREKGASVFPRVAAALALRNLPMAPGISLAMRTERDSITPGVMTALVEPIFFASFRPTVAGSAMTCEGRPKGEDDAVRVRGG